MPAEEGVEVGRRGGERGSLNRRNRLTRTPQKMSAFCSGGDNCSYSGETGKVDLSPDKLVDLDDFSKLQMKPPFLFFHYTQPCSRTIELTWGETATRKLKVKRQRDKKVAVSPSRPMICYAVG